MSQTTIELNASPRTGGSKGAARSVRREGRIPGVVYGHGVQDVLVSVEPRELEATLRGEYAYNAVFNLVVDGGETYQVMVKDLQFNSVARVVTHVDFKVVKNEDKIVLEVPVVTTGVAVGVAKGGRLDIVRRSVKVATTVHEIPVSISHDVSAMEIGDQVYIDEMSEPEGGKFEFNHRYPVIRVARRRKAVAVAEAEDDSEDDGDSDDDAAPAEGA